MIRPAHTTPGIVWERIENARHGFNPALVKRGDHVGRRADNGAAISLLCRQPDGRWRPWLLRAPDLMERTERDHHALRDAKRAAWRAY